MGMPRAPLLAALFLCSYEVDVTPYPLKKIESRLTHSTNLTLCHFFACTLRERKRERESERETERERERERRRRFQFSHLELSIFSVATFRWDLYMEYTSLSWYGIPELVVTIRTAFISTVDANEEPT